DTNILKEMTQRTKRSESFRPVFDFLRENEIVPFVLDVTKFEFLGYSTNKREYETLEKFIGSFWTHPLSKEDIELATRISAMYKCKNPSISPKQISFIDCVHAARMRKYAKKAVLITTDINDYPSFLFDMPKCIPIEEDIGSTSFVAFKTNNEEKWSELET